MLPFGLCFMLIICFRLPVEDVLTEPNIGVRKKPVQSNRTLQFCVSNQGVRFLSSSFLFCSVEQFLDPQMRQLTLERHPSRRKSFVNILLACHEKRSCEYSFEVLKMHKNTHSDIRPLFAGSNDILP